MIADFFINLIIVIIDNTIIRFFPSEIPGLTLSQFQEGFDNLYTGYQQSFNLIETFMNIELLFGLFAIILIAEFMLHFGFKGIKYLINLVRGSGA